MKYKAVKIEYRESCYGCSFFEMSCRAWQNIMLDKGYPSCADGYIYVEEDNIQLLKDIRKFFRRLPSEWYPESLAARLDEALEDSI